VEDQYFGRRSPADGSVKEAAALFAKFSVPPGGKMEKWVKNGDKSWHFTQAIPAHKVAASFHLGQPGHSVTVKVQPGEKRFKTGGIGYKLALPGP
jgi:hypothetical protein